MRSTVFSFTTCMSGTKFTTSIGSNAEQNSVRKTRQAEQEQEQEQEQGRRKCARWSTFPVVVLGLEAGLESNKEKVWMTPTSLNLMHPMTWIPAAAAAAEEEINMEEACSHRRQLPGLRSSNCGRHRRRNATTNERCFCHAQGRQTDRQRDRQNSLKNI
jgi:hypothetical protein